MEPVLVKEIVVAHAGRNFKNGAEPWDLPVADIDRMVRNFTDNPRQVPIFFRGDHAMGPQHADFPADGWVESLRRVGQDMVARVKLMGAAAAAVLNDTFRGISIGARDGMDLHGNPIGWYLDHLLITNAPFFVDLNIAARRPKADGGPVLYLTAYKEASMAEPEVKAEPEITPAEAEIKHNLALKSKDDEVISLKAEILGLREQLDNVNADPEKDELKLRVARLERKSTAQEIRELVDKGLRRGVLKAAWCTDYTKGGDEGTHSWFKASRFEGDMRLLRFQVEKGEPFVRLDKTYPAGVPAATEKILSQDDKESIRALGMNPDAVLAAMKAKDSKEFISLTAKKE